MVLIETIPMPVQHSFPTPPGRTVRSRRQYQSARRSQNHRSIAFFHASARIHDAAILGTVAASVGGHRFVVPNHVTMVWSPNRIDWCLWDRQVHTMRNSCSTHNSGCTDVNRNIGTNGSGQWKQVVQSVIGTTDMDYGTTRTFTKQLQVTVPAATALDTALQDTLGIAWHVQSTCAALPDRHRAERRYTRWH